jgi:hypothetical protein
MEDHSASKTEQNYAHHRHSVVCCFAHSHYMTQSEMRLLRPILLMPLIRVIALLCSGSTADAAQQNRVSDCLTGSEASRPPL